MQEPVKVEYRVAWINKIAEIPQTAWDELALKLKTPFLEWSWLNNMETSGSTTAQTGWLPNHLVVWRGQDLIAMAPLYVKGHSYGEFVFDHQWAELSERLGIDYYPKLLGMSPFTPAEGYRFLIAPGENEALLTEIMVSAIDQFCTRNQISGCNFLYVDAEWQKVMEELGFHAWKHHSYIWQNHNFDTFDDYLKSFNANQRRNIKRERKAVANTGLSFRAITGDDIQPSHLKLMHDFYADTCDKFGWWGSKYLTQEFFEQLHQAFRDRVVMFGAYAEGDDQPLGMSFCLTKGDRLYGRYWGSFQSIDCLHFDACYYSPIEWAIQNKIQLFDPGAGGRHKKRRGFPATVNYSLHRFYPPRLAQIFATYIHQINDMEQQEIDAINQELPFKKEAIALQVD
ncbi:N-acetyltransferase [filamentous cyanobacterium LEGE 11480]|uniref:N-acetyltransferase n=1 Tax=Romeriopsis navalis LEGE 11480 TaxID=2777977 RepID=A0A928Z3U0_9CYAN|nr:GNAT family N-acetyltransferase [Romeriopsis navalis]MBE9029613.1 N-acetyltransferase [Romeriopsis navalis LEGE 11480]